MYDVIIIGAGPTGSTAAKTLSENGLSVLMAQQVKKNKWKKESNMSRISEIAVRQLPEQYFLSVRRTIHFFTEYSDFIGKAIGEILPIIEANGAFPGSGLTVCFHNMELETLDVEIGFAVAQPIDPTGNVKLAKQPARTVAMTIDRGPYEQQDPTLEALMQWIPENGYEASGGIYYHYLNGEDQPQSEYLTEMSIPIVKRRG